jgi:hypothetical protein
VAHCLDTPSVGRAKRDATDRGKVDMAIWWSGVPQQRSIGCSMMPPDDHEQALLAAPNRRPLSSRMPSKIKRYQRGRSHDGVVHKHPSGDPTPSRDIEMTRQIAEVAKPLRIAVHDHVIWPAQLPGGHLQSPKQSKKASADLTLRASSARFCSSQSLAMASTRTSPQRGVPTRLRRQSALRLPSK